MFGAGVLEPAWKKAAEASQPLLGRRLDEPSRGRFRKASSHRLRELREDYPSIDRALEALRGHFVPIIRNDLFFVWT